MEISIALKTLGSLILEWGPEVVTGASIITAITKTPKKNKKKKLALIYKLIEFLALNIGRAKEKDD